MYPDLGGRLLANTFTEALPHSEPQLELFQRLPLINSCRIRSIKLLARP
jgi:hypothetical protein